MIIFNSKQFSTVLFAVFFAYPSLTTAKILLVPNEYPTISKAMQAAGPNDTVRVAAGAYPDNVIMRPGVTLEGGWDSTFQQHEPTVNRTIIDGSMRGGYVVFGADKAVLDGFLITGGKPPMMMPDLDVGPGVYCDSASFTVRNSFITGNNTAGIYARNCQLSATGNVIAANGRAGIFLEDACAAEIKGNLISRNLWAGINVGGKAPSKVDIANNAVYSNQKAGINVAFAQGSVSNNLIHKNREAGVRCGLAPMQIINNTIADNGLAGVSTAESAGLLTAAAPAGQSGKTDTSATPKLPIIKNNIIANNGQAGIKSYGSGYTYNLLYGNNKVEGFFPNYLWYIRLQLGGYEDQATFEKTKNILAAPLFVNPAQHDYHLRPGSPAIDQGDPEQQYNDKNFGPSLGADRNDMGVYGGPGTVAEKRPPNQPPQAGIEPLKKQVYAGDKVVLNGAVSRDPNGDEIHYQWRLTGKPFQSLAALKPEKDGTCAFTPDKGGQYAVQLTVTDRWGMQGRPVRLTINADPDKPPTAKISKPMGPVKVGEAVKLSAIDKKKQNGSELTFSWMMLRRPSDSQALLDDAQAERPSFTPDAPGCYTMRLTVANGKKSSQPDTVYFCTQESRVPGRRSVPDEYPTIQAAIDAAKAGEDILVQPGTYREHLIVDKPVNLIGAGRPRPVIDGGSKEGDEAAVFVCYLDNTAQGRIQGFKVTGGGTGQYGHGIQILNSSPEIVDNEITGNQHVGVGIHGQYKFTKDTRIHHNDIHDNAIGVSNGLGAGGMIYNNAIYNNKVTGIGVRGLARPIVRKNNLYGNYIGIGVREEAYPQVEDNIVQDNVVGMAVNPGVAGAIYAEKNKITLRNNQILSNRQAGIFISSLNKSEVVAQGNAIRGNSEAADRDSRTGGVVSGYPHEALVKVLLNSNMVSGNNGRDVQLYKELGESAGTIGSSAGRKPDFQGMGMPMGGPSGMAQ